MKFDNIEIDELTYNKTSDLISNSSSDYADSKNTKYNDAIDAIKNFIAKIIPDYGLSELQIDKNIPTGFETSFKIKIPENVSIDDFVKYSDEIFDRILKFAESHDIKFILDDLTITLSR